MSREKTNKTRRLKVRITPEEEQMLKGVLKQCREHDVSPYDVPAMWLKSKESSLYVRNPVAGKRNEDKFKDEILSLIKDYKPDFSGIQVKHEKGEHLLVIDPADVHIGKLASSFETGEDYNSQIAVRRVNEGIAGILEKVKGFKIDKILFIGGNDILHVDTPKNTTTSGTPQDNDGMWYDNFRIAFRLYADVLFWLNQYAPVHFVYCPSNHDYTNGFFLSHAIQQYFKDIDSITFNCTMKHRKYFRYGNNLIGATHGDGAKANDLPLLMAHESSQDWAKTKHRYIYIHHLHHKVSKDYMSVNVEVLRSPSGTDSWHHRKGYQHAPKAIEGYVHHKENGQIARITHLF